MTHKSLMMAVILATASATSFAQGPESGTQPAVETATQVGDQFHQMEYKGFLFDIPEESRVVIDRNMVARMPDGTFGVSMTVEEAPGTDQKRAENLCKGLANELKLRGATVDKIKINGIKGAIAKGKVENQDVSVLLLPYKGKEMVAVLMSDKEHKEMCDRYLRTIRIK